MTAALGVLLLGGGWWASYPPVLALGAGFVVLVLAEVLAVGRPEPVTLRRRISPLVVVRHGVCTGTLSLTRGTTWGLVRTVATDLVAGSPVPVDLPDTGADSHVDYVIPTPRRGLVPVGPVRLRRIGPTGMATRVEEHGEVEEVRVLPREIPLHVLPGGVRRTSHTGADRIELGGTDLTGLHPYVPGDDLRRLHWASSARTGSLMVREDAEPSQPHLLVLLDDREKSYPHDSDDFEDAVEVAAAICRTGIAAGNAVHLVTASGRVGAEVPASVSGVPSGEAAELSLLLAGVDTTDVMAIARVPERDLDTAVLVSGALADEHEALLALSGAGRSFVTLVDGAGVPTSQAGRALVLRGESADALATTWDLVVGT